MSSHASVDIVILAVSLGGTMLACFLGSQPSSTLTLHFQERRVYLAWRAQYRISPTATVIDSEGTQLESKRFGEILLKPLDHRHMPFSFRREGKQKYLGPRILSKLSPGTIETKVTVEESRVERNGARSGQSP